MERPVACRYCDRRIEAGCEGVLCPRCKAVHHVACWKEKGGCATRGCMQVASAIRPDPVLERERRAETGPARRVKAAIVAATLLVLLAALFYGIRHVRTSPVTSMGLSLHVMIWSSPNVEPALHASIDRFEARRADLDIHVESVPLGLFGAPAGGAASTMLYEQKLVVTLAARAAPDIFALPADRLKTYAEQGALLPLDPFLADGRQLDAGGRVGDHLYGFPNPLGDGWLAIWRGTSQPELSWELLSHLAADLSAE